MKTKEQLLKWMLKGITALICVVCVGILIQVNTISSFAYTQTTGTVNPTSAKIRAEANTTSAALASVASGNKLTIVDEVKGADGNTWYQVFVDASNKGYIRSDLVTKAGGSTSTQATTTATTTPTTTASTTSVTAVDSQSAWVSTSSARVRKDASATSDLVASVTKGVVMTASGKATGADGATWYKVSFSYNGTTISGFIRSDLISFEEIKSETPDTSVTEVTGSLNADGTNTSATTTTDAATTDAATTDATVSDNAAVSDNAVSDNATATTTSDSGFGTNNQITDVNLLQTDQTPALPTGFEEIALSWEDGTVRAWKNGDFYIFYASTADGNEGFYMYDQVERTYQRYFMADVDPATVLSGGSSSNKTQMIIIIVLAAILVISLVVITMLLIKVNDYKEEFEWEDDEDDYPEEKVVSKRDQQERVAQKKRVEEPQRKTVSKPRNFMDVDDDIEEIPVRRRPVNQGEGTPVRRPVNQGSAAPVRRPANQGEGTPVRRPVNQGEGAPARRPVSQGNGTPVRKPVYTQDDAQVRRNTNEQTRRPRQTVREQAMDPDDEDSFVFINLDGDDIR